MVTDYQLSRQQKLSEYLESLREESINFNGDSIVIGNAYKYFNSLYAVFHNQNKILEVPDCCPNTGSQGDFSIFFTWDKDEHYLECEIFENGEVEFYYRNRVTKQDWGEDTHLTLELSEEVVEKLSVFVE